MTAVGTKKCWFKLFVLLSCINFIKIYERIATNQPFVPGINDSLQHGLVKKAVSHPFRNNNVHLIHRQFGLLYFTFKDGNNCKT